MAKLKNVLVQTDLAPEQAQRLNAELTAAHKRLSTPQKTLNWFVDFLNDDLASKSEMELTLISYNLLGNCRGLDASGWGKKNPLPPMDVEALVRIQTQIRNGLYTLINEPGSWTVKGPEQLFVNRVSPVGAPVKLEFGTWTPDRENFIVHGFWQILFETGEQLRSCKRCKAVFLMPTKRAEYCSKDCAQRYRNEKKKQIKDAKGKKK